MQLLWWVVGTQASRQPAPFPSFADHGSDWAAACASGLQSPIELDGPVLGAPPVAQPFAYWLPALPSVEVFNDGRAIAARAHDPALGVFHPEVGWHALESVRLRASAEHTLRGHRAKLEVQIVNRAVSGSLLILSVLFDADGELGSDDVLTNYTAPDAAAGSAVLDTFLRQRPPRMEESHVENASATDFGSLLAGATFIEYAGSDTLPPCSPVMWLIREDLQSASTDQLARLHQALYESSEQHGNWRWIQPGNGRPLTVRRGVSQQMGANPTPDPKEDGWGAVGAYQKPGAVEFQGDQLARDVVTVEKYVTDYAHDLDVRLQRAAVARVAAAAPPAPAAPSEVPVPVTPGLEHLRALDKAQRAFRDEVEKSLHDPEIGGKLANASNAIARRYVRSTLTDAANGTQPNEAVKMYAALRGTR